MQRPSEETLSLHTASEMHRRLRTRLVNRRQVLAETARDHARAGRDLKEMAALHEGVGLSSALMLLDEVYLAIEAEVDPDA